MNESFGELRALLQQEPQEENWSRLCWLLERWSPDEFEETILPYVQAHLVRWQQPRIAYLPNIWRTRLESGRREPRAKICRSIRTHYNFTHEALDAFEQSEDLDGIIATFWRHNSFSREVISHLGRSRWQQRVQTFSAMGFLNVHVFFDVESRWDNVTSLALHEGYGAELLSPRILELLEARLVMSRLTSLSLGSLTSEHLRELVQIELPVLSECSMDIYSFLSGDKELIISLIEHLPALTTFELSVRHQGACTPGVVKAIKKRCKARGVSCFIDIY